MKKLFNLGFVALAVAAFATSCQDSNADQNQAPLNLVESSGIVGLWQQMQTTEVIDETTGVSLTVEKPRGRYKCIMPDGNYYLLDVSNDANGEVLTKILHYGNYTVQGDTMEIEHIECCSDVPSLNGHDSFVRYNLPDPNTFTLYYKFGVDVGMPGSSEWNQEVWKRVQLTHQ